MNVLKGFGLGILSFLLFLSLSVFGIAFMLNSTLLNPDFVTSEVDKIDVSALVIEMAEEQIGEQLPEEAFFLKEALYGVVSDQEPWLKEQLNAAIYTGYDFFLGKSERLDMIISLEPLKENLRDSLKEAFLQSLPATLSDLPPELSGLFPELADLPPELSDLPLSDLSPELAGLLTDITDQLFDQYYQEFAGQIPSEFAFDESSIPPEVMEQMLLARQYIGYFQTGYYYLIGFMVLLVLGIILINRNVRGTTRSLGIALLIYGALEFAGVYVARNFMPASLPLPDILSSLQMWLMGLFGDLLAPLQMFSLGVLIGGVVLLVVSFVYKPRVAED